MVFSAPPCNTLATKAPPGVSTSKAKCAAASHSAMILRWSVARWPLAEAAMSDSTTSAGPPSAAFTWASAFSSRKSSSRMVSPATGSTSWISTPSTVPRALPCFSPSALTRFTATCSQPPGAQPRSTTRAPGTRKRRFSSISISL